MPGNSRRIKTEQKTYEEDSVLLAIWMFAIVTCGAMPAYAQAQVQTQVPTKAQTKAAGESRKSKSQGFKERRMDDGQCRTAGDHYHASSAEN